MFKIKTSGKKKTAKHSVFHTFEFSTTLGKGVSKPDGYRIFITDRQQSTRGGLAYSTQLGDPISVMNRQRMWLKVTISQFCRFNPAKPDTCTNIKGNKVAKIMFLVI